MPIGVQILEKMKVDITPMMTRKRAKSVHDSSRKSIRGKDKTHLGHVRYKMLNEITKHGLFRRLPKIEFHLDAICARCKFSKVSIAL